MSLEKLFVPLSVVAAVVTIYLLFRQNNGSSTIATVPSAAASGVTPSSGAVTPVVYSVQASPTNPSAAQVLSSPNNAQPTAQQTVTSGPGVSSSGQQFYGNSRRKTAPANQSTNFGPSHDFTKSPPSATLASSGGCGCGGSCGSKYCNPPTCGKNNFSDGVNSGVKMVSSQAVLVSGASPNWIQNAAQNLQTYSATETGDSSVPTLTSLTANGDLSSTPDLGSTGRQYPRFNLKTLINPPSRASGFVTNN